MDPRDDHHRQVDPGPSGRQVREQRTGSTRPGCGVVVVGEQDGCWDAVWFDLGSVQVTGDRGAVLAWARAQPAAEHLMSVPGHGEDVALSSAQARTYLGE